MPTYLALGDSMSIDLYTGRVGGGAVSQFYRMLGPGWQLIDQTEDGRTMPFVATDVPADLITLTIGGNDAITRYEEIMASGLSALLRDHRSLLQRLRATNPHACLIVGNIYAPQETFEIQFMPMLDHLNAGIAENVLAVEGRLANVRKAFRGHEEEYLCNDIEPSLVGAAQIARLFRDEFDAWRQSAQSSLRSP